MAVMPGLEEVAAVVDGDAVEPRAPGRFAAELVHFPERLEKHILRGVLGALRIAEIAEREIVDGAAVFAVRSANGDASSGLAALQRPDALPWVRYIASR
jgi:hypothetical protein